MGKFKWRKIKLLEQFGIHLTDHELAHLAGLRTEIAVDNWGRRMILEHLDDGF